MAANRGMSSRSGRRPIDTRTFAEAFSGPGIDTRTWVSFGIVNGGDAGDPVSFDREDGQPYVYVTLEPSKVAVTCRVGMEIAGNGEGEWTPFINGDEVLVVMPDGREDNCVIIKRLCNSLDRFPMDSVAGQDPTKNAFGFRRRRTPVVEEFSGPIFFRSATTGAFFSIDRAGTVTLKDSENAVLQMSADSFSYQGPSTPENDPEFVLQFALTQRQFMLRVADAYFQISASNATPEVNTITVPGPFTMATIGNPAVEHVATAESVLNLLAAFGAAVPAFVTAAGIPAAVDAALAGVVAAAASNGLVTAMPASFTALYAAFQVVLPKPPGIPGKGQLAPGLGCPGFLAG